MSLALLLNALIVICCCYVQKNVQEDTLQVIPTFESAGVYWRMPLKHYPEQAKLEYRLQGDSIWRLALPLHLLPTADSSREYRGSLLKLLPGQQYEIRASVGKKQSTTSFQTWNEELPVKSRATLDKVNGVWQTRYGGDAQNGYVLYEPTEGAELIDGSNSVPIGIDVLHDWVIIRGWSIQNIKNQGIRLHGDASHVVIERCHIKKWGHNTGQVFAHKGSNAIHLRGSNARKASHIVIQDNVIEEPNCDTNNWTEPSDRKKAGNHPNGMQPIWLESTGGQLVIRYNTIRGTPERYYNDGMGEWRNFGPHGFPFRDSDIYGNRISQVWDNAIESEGGNINVRIFNNYTDSVYAHYGLSNITLGPLYLFANVCGFAHKYPGDSTSGNFLKIGMKLKHDRTTGRQWPANGIAYVFHNTLLQPVLGSTFQGVTSVATSLGPSGGVRYWNNIFHTSGNLGSAHKVLPLRPNSVVKGNLFFGGCAPANTGNEVGIPSYDTTNEGWFLTKNSPGFQSGVHIPGYTDPKIDRPDVGAYQTGVAPLHFGSRY